MNERQPQDQAVRDRVRADLGTTFAVEAGAGTGKTTLLTSRIVHAVATGHARIDQIVAITFTEKAANELKVRLREELERLLVDADGETADRLRDAVESLDTAHVSTIHSFASELLRERSIAAGVDPGFEVADTLRQSLLFDRVWTEWLADELEDPAGPLRPAFVAGLRSDQLKLFARFLRDNPDVQPAGDRPELGPIAEQFVRDAVPRLRAAAERMIQLGCPPDCTCVVRTLPAAAAVDHIEGRPADEQAGVLLSFGFEPSTRPQNACKDKERKKDCVAEMKAIGSALDVVRPDAGQWLVRHLADLMAGMLDRFARAKRDEALLDFNDLLLKARDLLRDNKRARSDLQRRFRMILVDECQDTDPLQTEIALFLAEDGATADTWREARPAPGKLMFVGDPKQSIYRFRRADIEMYEEAKAVVREAGELANITQNFRSTPTCIGWVNAVFAELIARPDDGDYQPDYVPLHAFREDTGPEVELLDPPEGVEFDYIDAARAAEARAVAAHIAELVRSGQPVLDKKSGRPRPMAYGDVALLFRTRRAFSDYEQALDAAGVPYRAESGRGFFARQEVVEVQNVLAAVERPYDPAAVVAALRTTLMGVSDTELAEAAAAGFDYLARIDPDDSSHLQTAFRLLADWHEARNSISFSALVARLLSETKALELYYLKPDGEQRAANLTKLIDFARAFEGHPGATFGGFVRWLAERSTAAEEEESHLADDRGDFVSMITIHGAKGLEFPVVVLCDAASSRQATIDQVIDRILGQYHIRLGAGGNVQTVGFEEAKQFEKRRDGAEKLRLFYVAATRARDRLVIPRFPRKKREEGYLEYLARTKPDARSPFETVVIAQPDDPGRGRPGTFRADLSQRDGEACAELCAQRDAWQAERAELIRRASEGDRLRTASGLADDDFERIAGFPPGESEARQIGKAVHSLLEQIDLTTGDGLERLAQRAASGEGIPARADLVEELVRKGWEMESVQRAARAERLYREVPFAVCVGGAVLEGLIDLAFEDEDGLHIVDFKTDDVTEGQLGPHAERYRPQVGAYALAAREVFDCPPASATLLLLRPGVEFSIPVDDALLSEVKEML